MNLNQSFGSLLRILGGVALFVVSLNSEAQFQTETKVVKPTLSNQVTRTPARPIAVYAPASEVTRKFIQKAWQGDFDASTFLLQQGADINCQVCFSNNGETLLMHASSSRRGVRGLNPLLPWLVKNGANPKLTDATGNTMLHYVFVIDVGWGLLWPEIRSNLEFILDLGIDPKAKNNNGDTALHVFARDAKLFSKSGAGDIADYASLVTKLVSAGANIDEQNVAGRTPLMMSLGRCSLPIAKVYLNTGASANIKDAAGQGLAEIAKANAIQSPTKECIEVANFFANPQNLEIANSANTPYVQGAVVAPSTPLVSGNFPKALVSDFQGVIKSSLQAQPVSAKGKIDESGHFEYAGDNGVVMTGSFDASGPEIEGHGVTRLPIVGGRQLTYPNGENEARVALLARFDGQILRGSYMSKFEKGTFSLCSSGVTSAECTATANPLGAIFKGIGSFLGK